MTKGSLRGFTLIELSIVLVVIGLIVGGVLVGQSLISAAAVRAQISQIEKFNTAANTFYGKYGYLPGDIPAAPAAQFGFAARGQYAGEGDGNGVIEGNTGDCSGCNNGDSIMGETGLFWVDLSSANMIDGGFTLATANTLTELGQPVSSYLPKAKLGSSNWIYVGGFSGINRFFLGGPVISIGGGHYLYNGGYSGYAITVIQAYIIDNKIDDGIPDHGNVRAELVAAGGVYWAGTGLFNWLGDNGFGPIQAGLAVPGTSVSCADNGNNGNAAYEYSITQNNGAGVNCALSFRFQ